MITPAPSEPVTADTLVFIARRTTEAQTLTVSEIADITGLNIARVAIALQEGVGNFLDAYGDSELLDSGDISKVWSGEIL